MGDEFSPSLVTTLGSMLWSQFSAIFENFRQKNWRFSQKPMLWSQFLHNLALFWGKNAKFIAEFFSKNIFKIITSVPGHKLFWEATYYRRASSFPEV
jgi:hypothetical protein